MAELIEVPPGLAGVAVTATEIGDVVGDEGYYHYRGRSATDLARSSTFEEVAGLVLNGSPGPLSGDRSLPSAVADLVPNLDFRSGLSLLGSAIGCSSLPSLDPADQHSQAERLIATLPTLIASIHHGRPIEPDPDQGHVADYLRMLSGATPSPEIVEALETYFVLTIDHGFSNSTFATRVVASAGADIAACVLAGWASLSGPRHGADIERILDVLDAIESPERAEDWLREEIASRRRLHGFGHSVYRSPDPRLDLMREYGALVAPDRHRLAMAVEEAGIRLLAGKRLVPNVDLHAPIVLEGCGIPRGLFTPTFSAARVVGWCAHAIEQANDDKILRPGAHYIGPLP